MENERRTEYNVDMRPEEDFLSDILSASQIRATDTYETPPQIIWIDNSSGLSTQRHTHLAVGGFRVLAPKPYLHVSMYTAFH